MAPVTLPPGFRFHPTDEELVAYYLKRKINGRKIELEVIPEVDLYKCEPWELPEKSFLPSKDLEWPQVKDRKVNSQMRSVGMKKTLVYYRGRAPHGTRTGWVMHEYRLDEKECETASGLQDAYALCRIFKKSMVGPKTTEQYNAPSVNVSHYQWTPNDHSSNIEVSSEGGGTDMEITSYPFTTGTCSSSMNQGALYDINGTRDEKWMQYLTEEAFGPTTPAFPSQGSNLTYVPSKVDIALECARLQHRLSLPPLEVDDFPQVDFSESQFPQAGFLHERSGGGILEEILSVASASQELINPSNYHDTWQGSYSYFNELSHQNEDIGSSKPIEKPWGVEQRRFIQIGDMEEEFMNEKAVENLRGVGMSNKELEKGMFEDHNIVSIENISNYRTRNEQKNEGELNNFKDFNDTDENDFSLGFVDDYQDGSVQEDGDIAGTPTFELYEKVEVNHGMFIANHQVAETFFYQIEPSKTLKVNLNQVLAQNFSISKANNNNPSKVKNRSSFFGKFKAFAREKFRGVIRSMEPWRESCILHQKGSKTVLVISLLLTSCIYFGEPSESVELWHELSANSKTIDDRTMEDCSPASPRLKKMKKVGREKWNGTTNNDWLANFGGHISSMFLNKKWSFYAIILALFSLAFHQSLSRL
ncbi:hypothetical protein IFM89_013260 [Coptis chinensis]|uniref:NAC domain-containing protein n=1 Tax=Coptis chinensis TaxID=261450 RepID=A0A835IYS0_9MAGN|nr:hypothetical protein IFM89_013260 [Coptis chinensis]